MSISIRELFSRQNIANEVISLRNSLANHQDGSQLGLIAAYERFTSPADGNGYACGCHRPSQSIAGDLAYVVPSWVPVSVTETRTLEGVLTKSRIAPTDFPLRPWHTYYDWNFFIRLDKQYTYLHSVSNIHDHDNIMECEWDTAFLPDWAWPMEGSRIWMVGRWIYDCGHPGVHGHKTEIHPPKAIVSFRSEAVHFSGNSAPVRANNAVIYIGRNGGYWHQSINDQDYSFDLYLPPKPYSEAVPKWKVLAKTANLPVQPRVTPFPADNPKALRVVIPLHNIQPHPDEYGAIISGGWSDSLSNESAQIQQVRLHIDKIYMDGNYDTFGDEWYVYIGINGRWRVWKSIGGSSATLNYTIDLDLHSSDKIHIVVCGFEADLMHDFMGKDSGYTWAHISNPALTKKQREAIEDHIFRQLSASFKDENDKIGYLSRQHDPHDQGSFTAQSDKRDYRVSYTISS